MNVKIDKNDPEHVSREQIVAYALRPDLADSNVEMKHSHIARHIHSCSQCGMRLKNMKKLVKTITLSATDIKSGNAGHLSLEEIIGYLYEDLSGQELEVVRSHLDACGVCSKQILMLKTRLLEYSDTVSCPNVLDKEEGPKLWLLNWRSAAAVAVLAFFLGLMLNRPSPEAIVTVASDSSGIMDSGTLRKVSNGINWYAGYVEASGVGSVSRELIANRVQAQSLALKTARHVAYAKISEVINGVYVSSEVSYQNMLSKSDSLLVRHQGMIRNAQVVKEQIAWQDGLPKASVTIRVPMYSVKGISGVVSKEGLGLQLETRREQGHGFVVDARNTGFRPSLYTRLSVSGDTRSSLYRARYYDSLEALKRQNDSPLPLLRALPQSNRGVLLVDKDELDRLDRLPSQEILVLY